jgi:YfiH family protein
MNPTDPTIVPDWPAPPNVRALATTRRSPGHSQRPFDTCNLGARCGDDPAAVAANRAGLVATLGLPAPPHWVRQVHGTDVFDADGSSAGDEAQADAAIARSAGRVLAVLSADCLPLLFCADDGSAIGAAHAGWRGLLAGVIERTVARLGVPPASVLAWLGPAIGPRSYEVGDEVRAAFVDQDQRAAEAFVPTRPGHWLCDLYALAHLRLAAAGVSRVYGGGFDTFADARFYSYRRDRETGRFASLIWIEGAPQDAALQETRSSASIAATRPALFARLLGDAFATLPPRVRNLHLAVGTRRYRGAATVRRGTGWLSRLCGWAAGLPAAAPETPIEVEIATGPHDETWARNFGMRAMRSRLWQDGLLLRERLGLVTLGFALSASGGILRWEVRQVRCLGVSMPARWFGGVRAYESELDGRYRFDVRAVLPLAGELVHYEGWLAVAND